MAAELGTSKSTVRRWLRRDHWDLWMENWASVDEIWEARRDDPGHVCLVNLLVNGSTVHSEKFMAELNRSLLELTDADQIG
jgi:hypothetical protein